MQVTVKQFREWLAKAKKGDKFVYHVGVLPADRHAHKDASDLWKAYAHDVHELADLIWNMAGMEWDDAIGKDGGWTQSKPHDITLVQHRIMSGCEYIAVRT